MNDLETLLSHPPPLSPSAVYSHLTICDGLIMVLSPRIISLVLAVSFFVRTSAFSAPAPAKTTSSSRLGAVKFDKSTERWVTDDPDEEAGSSYGPVGSLYRAGPKPFFSRVFDADTYE